MRVLTYLALLVTLAFVSCHPALEAQKAIENLETIEAKAKMDPNQNSERELIRQARSFGRRGCCGGGGGFYGRPYGRPYGGRGGFGGGGGGFGGSSASASASASASSSGGGFGFGK